MDVSRPTVGPWLHLERSVQTQMEGGGQSLSLLQGQVQAKVPSFVSLHFPGFGQVFWHVSREGENSASLQETVQSGPKIHEFFGRFPSQNECLISDSVVEVHDCSSNSMSKKGRFMGLGVGGCGSLLIDMRQDPSA